MTDPVKKNNRFVTLVLFVLNQIRIIKLGFICRLCLCCPFFTELSWAAIGTDFNIFIAMQISRSFSTGYALR